MGIKRIGSIPLAESASGLNERAASDFDASPLTDIGKHPISSPAARHSVKAAGSQGADVALLQCGNAHPNIVRGGRDSRG